MPSDEMQQLWQTQPAEAVPIELQQIRRKASALRSHVTWRNVSELAVGLPLCVLFAWLAWRSRDTLERAALLLLIAGTLFDVFYVWHRGSARPLPADMGLTDAFAFQCKALAQQRDLLRSVVRWYLAPVMPGWAVMVAYVWRAGSPWAAGLLALVFAAVFCMVRWMNQRAVKQLDRQMAELFSWEDRS